MRNTRKILIALLVVMTLLVSMATLFASAASQPETLYLTPNANWNKDGARFAAYFFGNGETWVSMTDSDKDGIYEVKVPTDKVYPNVIFCRMNPSAAANNWDNKWNQTADLAIPTDGPNHYTVKEGTWDKGGGTWSTFGSTCLHTNLGAAATCTTPQVCNDCGDPVVSALGHAFNNDHLCTRCNEQASFTVAGSGAHLGTEWDTGNTANDMTYADGVYTKVYTNVAAGSYAFKVARDHDWGTAYPSADKTYSVATSGSTVTITLKGTTVNVVVEAPHVHTYTYPCDKICNSCFEESNPDAAHTIVHVDAVAATCYEDGNVEYWYCSDCGSTWTDEALTQVSNQMSIVTPMAHAPATHVEAKAPACYENGNLEYWYCEACGQAWLDEACTQNTNLLAVVLPMAHAEAKHVEAKAATCTENGNIEYWLCEACGQAWLDADCTQNTNVLAVVLPAAHNFADGKCTVCGEADPDYVAPGTPDEETEHTFTSDLVAVPNADKDVLPEGTKYVNDYFTIVGKVTIRWSESKGVYAVELDKKSNGGIEFTVAGNSTIVVSFASTGGSNLSLIGLVDANGTAITPANGVEEVTGTGFITVTYNVGAGTYKVVNPSTERNTRVNSVAVAPAAEVEPPHEHVWSDATCTEPQKCDCGETKGEALGHSFANGVCSVCGAEDPNYVPPHVNALVVGDTNKIVVSGNFVNDYNLPIEWVPFVADESAYYSFVGDNGALAVIFDANGALVSATGAANLEAGNYLICLGNGVVGEFNVAVTKSAWVNALALGDNKLLITDVLDNGAGYYIVWVSYEVTEKANYTFTGDGILALVYDSAYAAVSGTELDVGTYNVCVAFLTPATTGIATVKVEKTPIEGGEPTPEPELPALQLGDNTVTIDGSQTNLTGNAVAWYTFTPAEAGTYKFSCDDLTVYILVDKNMSNLDSYIGADGVAELEAGTMYYILVGKDGVTGDFTVNVSDGAAPAHKNTIAVGDNKYIISDSLLATGFEFLLIEITEGGIYKFTGGAPMTLFVFHDPYVGEALDSTAPYTDNADDITYEYVEYFYVNLPTPGYYWVGFRYDYVGDLREFDINVALHSEHTFEEGKCECGTADPNYQPPHEHNFVNGECECGEKDPNYNPPEQPDDDTPADPKPEPELNFFQKIWKAITDFFANIGNWFKNLFAKK